MLAGLLVTDSYKTCPPPLLSTTIYTNTLNIKLLYHTALQALLRCDFWAVFTRLVSVVRVATLYGFAVAIKHLIWWQKSGHSLLWMGVTVRQIFPHYIFVYRAAVTTLTKCYWHYRWPVSCVYQCTNYPLKTASKDGGIQSSVLWSTTILYSTHFEIFNCLCLWYAFDKLFTPTPCSRLLHNSLMAAKLVVIFCHLIVSPCLGLGL